MNGICDNCGRRGDTPVCRHPEWHARAMRELGQERLGRDELNKMFKEAFSALVSASNLPVVEYADIHRKQRAVADACDEVKRIAMMTPAEFIPKEAPPRPLSEATSYWPEDLFTNES